MLRLKLGFIFARIGLVSVAKVLNRGHWFEETGPTICCGCGLESCYWQDTSHKQWLYWREINLWGKH